MKDDILKINPEKEKNRIVDFLKDTFAKQGRTKAIIGLSGGIDSTLSFFLLKEFLPPEDIIIVHMYDIKPVFSEIEKVVEKYNVPKENIHLLSIKSVIEETVKLLKIGSEDKLRRGNIAARTRMIVLFDLAKKYKALVVGTENKSENLLGYFTRFGDQASDIEPIEHLYKTQVYGLAQHLGVPEEIIDQDPSAGLWVGQTDEGQFGFTYKEADQVLYLHLEKHQSVDELREQGFQNARKILAWRQKNLFKHQTPYTVESS